MNTATTTRTAITFRQYATAVRQDKRDEFGITWAEAEEFYPDHVLRLEWVRGLVELAEAGGEFPASVVRTLTEDERYAVNKFGFSFSQYV